MNYKDLAKANSEIKTTLVKGKQYAEVKERIIAFRKVFPTGFIKTEIVKDVDKLIVIHAQVGYYADEIHEIDVASSEMEKYTKRPVPCILGEGTAYEIEGSSNINKGSYIENCETSAVGRALGMAGFGIDTAIASADEMRYANLVDDDIQSKPVPTSSQKNDPELQAIKEEFAATMKNHGLNGAIICRSYGINSKPTKEQLLAALEDIAKKIEADEIPKEWRM